MHKILSVMKIYILKEVLAFYFSKSLSFECVAFRGLFTYSCLTHSHMDD